MSLPIYQVDAFAVEVFTGNPAAVVPLDAWVDDALLQKIAQENNLSETAFFVVANDKVELRWFTPNNEVDLCGHATLAAAHVLFTHLDYVADEICFITRSGDLFVQKRAHGYEMDFPADLPQIGEAPKALLEGLGLPAAKQVLSACDYIVVLENEMALRHITPDFSLLHTLDLRGVVVTAQGDHHDFVSRCFFPKLGVNEDPVTGSAHCELAPYWAKRLGKSKLVAKQLSSRTGTIGCELLGDRVKLFGQAVDYMHGEFYCL